MSTIRLPATQVPVQPAPFSAARTAQLAFFRAALDRVESSPTTETQTSAGGSESETARSTDRYARPGALVDIRV